MGRRRDKMFEVLCFLFCVGYVEVCQLAGSTVNRAIRARLRHGFPKWQAKQKARITSYLDLLNEDKKEKVATSQIIIPNGQRLGSKVIDAENGLSLLEVAHNNGVALEGACEGSHSSRAPIRLCFRARGTSERCGRRSLRG